MKRTTYVNNCIFVLVFLLSIPMFSQNFVPFTSRFDQDVKGDIVLIGNNILGPSNNDFNDTSRSNDGVDMRYIDIDSDPTTFSSSSADLGIPNPNCFRIIHAGLYWSAVTKGSESITNVKLRGPSGGYIDVVGSVIYDAGTTSVDNGDSFPYACYADVTGIINGLGTQLGTYTVANVSSAQGRTADDSNFTGHSSGWSLFIVYEDPTVRGRSITSFDGFSAISIAGGNPRVDVPVSGFRTIPTGPVRANFAFATLEGDSPIPNDFLGLNGRVLSSPSRPWWNFFNSSISQLGGLPINRNPNSANTLGFDTGIINVPNPTNSVIANNDTSATVTLLTRQDTYFPYFFALAVEIIQPEIVLTKLVEDASGGDIGGQLVDLGDELNYIIGFQNVGNDDARNFTIRDVLPINITFDYPSGIVSLPPGVTVQSYNPATRELIFDVDDSVVEQGDPLQEIRFRVNVVSDCSLLTDACSNIVSNQAFATYIGTINPDFIISDDPSFNTNTGCLIIPSATNFLADLNCTFDQNVILCGDSTVLTAGDGYDAYTWSTTRGGPAIATGQSFTVTSTGTYYVFNEATAPCQSITQVFNVQRFGVTVANPVIPFADQVVTCPNDGKELPNIFLCGGGDSRFIQTNITDTSSMIWEILDESSCDPVLDDDCANESDTCTWNQVATGANYTADTAGQYRLTLNYSGGCFNRFYFNVYENLLVPNVDSRDIICTTSGQIVIGGVPSGYEYSIDGINYQSDNTFDIDTPGIYTAYLRQIGVSPNPCIFTVPLIQIRERDFQVQTNISQPLCNGDLGSVALSANDARPQYSFSISRGGTLVNSVGPILDNTYTFNNLNPGTYTVNVSTEDGCTHSEDIEIIEPALLEATSALTQPLTCTDGEITVTPVGGTDPYFYFVNGNPDFQSSPIVEVPSAGLYTIRVVDSNNCEVETMINVDAIADPEFTVSSSNILCADSPNSGTIDINVTNANGYTLRFSIDNGTTFFNSPSFSGLVAGNYDVVVEYTLGTAVCTTTAQPITISAISSLTGNATLTTPYTCTSNGVITVSGVTGGTDPYEYSIDGINFQTGTTFTGLTDGTYTITIRDASLCTITAAPIVINPLDPPTDLNFSNTALSCPDLTTDVTITSTVGGRLPLEYQIIAPSGSATAYQSSNIFTGLSSGTYTFQVRDADQCTYSESYNIQDLPPLGVVGQTVSDISCFGATDGAVRFTVSGTTNYTYTINGGASTTGASPINLTGLSADTYTIVITDNTTNCTATANATVSAPPAALSVSTSETAITCLADGSVTITASNGWGGYQYELTQPDATILPSQPSNVFNGLTQAGTYTVTVTDANGCEETATFSLGTPLNPTATLDATSDLCYDVANAATIVVATTGGLAPYEYSINSGPFGSSNTFNNLTPNNYTIVVRDANGCLVNTPLAVTVAPELNVSATITEELDCTTSPDAEITVTVSGGTAPYGYRVNVNGAGYSGSAISITGSTFVYSTSVSGTYQFEIIDATGATPADACAAESSVVTIAPISNPTATENLVNPTCSGDTNGSVEIIPSGGEGPYTISFNGSAFTATTLYTGLGQGTYPYEVRDSNSCSFTGSVTLTAPSNLQATASSTPFSCSTTNTSQPATVSINLPTGGTAPYQYSFNGSGYSAINTLTVNDNGTDQTITWSVRDAQNCTVGGSETLTALNPPVIATITNAPPVTCTTSTSTVTVNVTAGTGVGTLTYEITSPAAAATSNTTGVFSGLAPDTYIFRVTDASGCFTTQSFNIPPVTPIAVTGSILSNVACIGDNTGAIRFTVSGFSGGYTSALISGTGTVFQSGNTVDVTNLVAGTYTLEVTDSATGCTDDATIAITEPTTGLSFTAVSTNVNCNNDESQITITASGGTPSYSYAAVVSGAAAPATTAYVGNNIITVDTNSGTDLVWDVYVRDVNNCTTSNPITITSDPLPTVTTPPLASNQCTATTGYTFTVTGAGGLAPLEYSINGGVSYQSSPTFTVNAAASYTVTVRDANGCTATSTSTTDVFNPLISGATLTKDLTCTAPVDATIDVTVSGGSGTYTTYEVSTDGGTTYNPVTPTPAGVPFTFSTASAGTYQFRITDSNSCSTETNEVVVNPTVTVTASEVSVNPTCNGDNNGSITLTATAGEPPFTYSLDGGTTFNSSNVFGGLVGATYSYVVRDNKGCDATGTVTLTNPPIIDVTITPTPITCGPTAPGSFLAQINSGGVAPFEYNLYDRSFNLLSSSGSTAATSFNFPNLTFGDYYITIVDANGCEYNSGIQRIDTPPILSLNGFVDSNNCSNGVDYTVTTTGGVAPYIFSIFGQPATASPPQASPSYTFTGLLHNTTYFLQVEDVNNCISILEITTPTAPSTIAITGITETNVTCDGADNGTLAFTVDNYDGAVTDINYELLDALSLTPLTIPINGTLSGPAGGPVSTTITNIPAGNYVLQAREATGTLCSATYTFQITQPIQALTASITNNVNANCNTNAQVTVSAIGGTGPYQYEAGATGFGSGSGDVLPTTNNVLVLDDSIRTTWEILVTDANGCPFRLPVTIGRDTNPTIAPIPQQCFVGTPLSITLSGTTFNSVATYSIDGVAFQTSPTFSINTAGTYTATIRDTNGCTAQTTLVVEPQLFLNANLTQDLTCTVDASVTLAPTGGAGTYTAYEVSSDGGTTYTTAGIVGTTFTTNTDGTYQFRVTDSQGCLAESNSVVVTPTTTPTLTEQHFDVTCAGDSDGRIIVTASNGVAPYQYSIDNGVNFQASNTFTGLNAAGSPYNIVVRDSKNCTSVATPVTINEPSPVTGTPALVPLSCGIANATQSATLTITPGGGTAPYTYSFDGGTNYSTVNTFTTTVPSTITAFVRDSRGCISLPITETIQPLDPPTDLTFASTPITCTNTTTDVTLTTTGGLAPLTYVILSPASATSNTSGSTTGIFTGLGPDTYLFEVTDANSCTYQEAYTIDPVTNITVSGLLANNVTCNGALDGAVTFTVGNFSGTYSYTINGGTSVTGQTATTISLPGLASGNQIIIVTDDVTGCTNTATIPVSEPPALTLAEDLGVNANCNLGAQVSVTASGGTPGYTYAFVEDGVTPTASDYTTSSTRVLDPATNLNWDVYVQDANGCTTPIDIVIATDPLPTVILPTLAANQCNLTGDPYTFTITSSTGVPPLSYSIGNGFQTSGTFTVSSPGIYNVTVRDGNNCIATSTTSITIYEPLGVTPTITALPSCTNNDGVITTTGSGGSGTYSFDISPRPASITQSGTGGNVFSSVPSGTYTVTITDVTTTCTNVANVVLSNATPVTFTTTPRDVSCNGGSDGAITVNLPPSNDNPVYNYEIIAPITRAQQTSNVFEGLPADTYTVRVTSGRNCELIQNATVGEPNALTVSGNATPYSCTASNVVNTSTLTISEADGTAPYTYSIDGTNYFSSNSFDIIDTGSIQNIDIYVRDNNNCIASNTVTINPLEVITATVVAEATPIDCNGTGSVAITVTGGSGTFTYQMLPDGVPQASNTFNITEPGDYFFQVNDTGTSCFATTMVYSVTPFNNADVVLTPTTAVTCFGDNSGAFEINVSNYSGAYTYQIVDGMGAPVGSPVNANTSTNPLVVTGVSGGNYSVEVTQTDSPFCVLNSNVILIDSPAEPLTVMALETSNVTCENDRGTITATATGGWGSYEYELTGAATVPYSTNGTFPNLAAGTYTVNVRDARNCIVSSDVTLIIPTSIDATILANTSTLSCFGDTNAFITVTNTTGGQGSNYTYTLNQVLPVVTSSGPQISTVFNNLGAGTYNVTVRDGYNCEFTTPNLVIGQPSMLEASLVKATSQTCLTQTDLTLSATGGTGPYTYSEDSSFTTILGTFTTSTTFSVSPGEYSYYVRDANNCTADVSNDIRIDPLPDLTIELDLQNATIKCRGDITGVIVATAQGGLGNYVYTLQDEFGVNIAPAPIQNSPGDFRDLPVGRYRVRVDSGDCIETSEIIEIEQPEFTLEATFNVTPETCAARSDGSAEIIATGGTGIIKYAISPDLNQFFDEPIFEDLAPGNYEALAQDQNGCFVSMEFTIQPADLVFGNVVDGSIVPEVCTGELEGAFSVEISGGTLPYRVSLDNPEGPYITGDSTQTIFDFPGLTEGDHTVYFLDVNGCDGNVGANLGESVLISPQATIQYDCLDNMPTNTVIVNNADDSIDPADLEYSLNGVDFQASNTFVNVPVGLDYVITVRHTNGCEQPTIPFDIESFDPVTLQLSEGRLNEIVATATGGSGNYEYFLDGESYGNDNTFLIFATGTYTVTVVDRNFEGCQDEASIPIEFIDLCIPNYFTPDNDGVLDYWEPGCAEQYDNLTFDIFDRYGRKVATLNINEKWDGTYKGKELPTGDYWYVVKLNESRYDKEFVGHFTLYR